MKDVMLRVLIRLSRSPAAGGSVLSVLSVPRQPLEAILTERRLTEYGTASFEYDDRCVLCDDAERGEISFDDDVVFLPLSTVAYFDKLCVVVATRRSPFRFRPRPSSSSSFPSPFLSVARAGGRPHPARRATTKTMTTAAVAWKSFAGPPYRPQRAPSVDRCLTRGGSFFLFCFVVFGCLVGGLVLAPLPLRPEAQLSAWLSFTKTVFVMVVLTWAVIVFSQVGGRPEMMIGRSEPHRSSHHRAVVGTVASRCRATPSHERRAPRARHGRSLSSRAEAGGGEAGWWTVRRVAPRFAYEHSAATTGPLGR